MLQQVAAHIGGIGHNLYTQAGQQRGRADAGKLEQLGRLYCASRQNDFLPDFHGAFARLVPDHNAGGALVREQDTTDIGIGDNVELGPVADWTEEGARRREASALPRHGCLIRNAAMSNRSEEHTSELQSLMGNSYAVLCLKKKTYHNIVS